MRALVTCAIRSLIFCASPRACSGFTISQLSAFFRLHFLLGKRVVLLPTVEIRDQILYDGAIGLILDRCFHAPSILRLSQLNLVVAILDDDALKLVALEINDVTGAAFYFLGVG